MTARLKWSLLMLAALGGIAAAQATEPTAAVSETLAQSRSRTIEDLAAKLTDRFVDPDVGRRYVAMLRANAASGKYAAIKDDVGFAEQVTNDLQAVAFDGHLKLLPPDGQAQAAPSPRGPLSESKTIEAIARMTPDIAYIRLGNFFGEEDSIAAIGKFLRDNADAKTLIFDVRTHRGGGLAEMDAMFPYLFDKETVLLTMDTRSAVEREGGFKLPDFRLRQITSPDTIIRREHYVVPAEGPRPLAKARIFVLASGRTGSAGEHFVLAMRRTHRATIIGETTYGAGNFGGFTPIEGGFSAFIPVGRTFDPDTNKGWDYVGIAPDVSVPAASALTEALVRSGLAKAEAEKLSTQYGPAPDKVASLRKAPASVPGM